MFTNHATAFEAPYSLRLHMKAGDTFAYDPNHDTYVVRDDLGRVTGSYVPYTNIFTSGLPYWMDPQNVATVAAAEITPEVAEGAPFEAFDPVGQYHGSAEIEEPEPVIAVIDSPQADDEIFEDAHQENAVDHPFADDVLQDIEQAQEQLSDDDYEAITQTAKEQTQGERLFEMMVEAAQKDELLSFHYTTRSGVSANWSSSR